MASSLADLPAEILLHIFEYLPLRDLLAMKQVRDAWRPLIAYKSLYKSIQIGNDVRLSTVVGTLSKYARVIRAVAIRDRGDTNAILRAVAKCDRLRRLKLKNCDDTRSKCISTALLIRIFRQTELRDFVAKYCTCFVHVLSILPPEPVAHPMIGFTSGSTDSATQRIHFVGPHFLSMLRASRDTLRRLRIVDANINFLTSDFTTMFQLIGDCCNLEDLRYHVPYLTLTDDNFRQLYKLKNLKSLSVRGLRDLSTPVLSAFFEPSRTSGIRKLELFDATELDATTIRAIGAACPNLECLTVVTKEFVRKDALDELANSFGRLQTLRLSFIPPCGIDALVELSRKVPSLRCQEFQLWSAGAIAIAASGAGRAVELSCQMKLSMRQLMSTFDVKISCFGRVSCQRKRQFLMKSYAMGLSD